MKFQRCLTLVFLGHELCKGVPPVQLHKKGRLRDDVRFPSIGGSVTVAAAWPRRTLMLWEAVAISCLVLSFASAPVAFSGSTPTVLAMVNLACAGPSIALIVWVSVK